MLCRAPLYREDYNGGLFSTPLISTDVIMFRALLALCVACWYVAPSARAAVVYSEPTNGELSGDNMAPTDLGLFDIGTNSVSGTVTAIGPEGLNGTADIFTFEIGNGTQLDTIVLSAFNSTSSAVFLALDDGPTFQYSAEEINNQFVLPDLTQILGGSVVGTANLGTDILDNLQNAVNLGNGSAFDVPLQAGNYSIYIQETGPTSSYTLEFNVSAVPEPSSSAAIGIAALALLGYRLRKRRHLSAVAS